MSIEVFFNRPGRPIPLERLLEEIGRATESLAIAAAWFTSNEIADAVIRSRSPVKYLALNAADIDRDGGLGRRILERLVRAIEAEREHEDRAGLPRRTEWMVNTLGSETFKEGILHHKFILIDRRVVWTGSYNLTYQAARNYETLLRIEDESVGRQFAEEFVALGKDVDLWRDREVGGVGDGAFRCFACKRIHPSDRLAKSGGYLPNGAASATTIHVCAECLERSAGRL